MNRIPSVAPWPVVPIIVTAESCVAMTSPTAHHGRLRLARKYPSMPFVPRDRRRPCVTTYASHPTMMTQFSGCICSRAEMGLQQPEQQERDDLHGHHAGQRPPKPTSGILVAHRRSHAKRAPSAISTPPVTCSSHALTLGRVRIAPSRSTNHAYAVNPDARCECSRGENCA